MTRSDPDLIAVRELPPGLAEPTDESLARTWHALAVRRAPAARPARTGFRLRLPVPAMAAALVVAVAVGAVALIGGRGPAAGPDAAATTSSAALFDRLIAAAASARPRPLADGQFIYVRSEAVPGGLVTESWLDPQGMIAIRVVPDRHTGPRQRALHIAQERAELVAHGPGLARPTPRWWAGLPTEPAALRRVLISGLARMAGMDTADEDGFAGSLHTTLMFRLSEADPILRSEVRVALYRVLADLPALTARRVTVAGRQLIAVSYEVKGLGKPVERSVHELLFDPVTGRSVGGGQTTRFSKPPADIRDLDIPGRQASPGPTATERPTASPGGRLAASPAASGPVTYTSWTIWSHGIVANTSHRP
ncbi:MAG TPA: hypothetical protein VES42_05200 [Pilimelia sp.]|nr:hypothetical protein [Pilimelia sp.]